jgi:choline-sulfatase
MYPEYNIDMPNIPPGHLEELHLGFQVLRQASMLATPIPEDRIRRARAGYYGMITELYEYVGQVWDQLEHSGELENTLFIYTSDHGESLGEHGLWHKNNLYEQSAHIPLIIAGAGLPQDNVINTPVAHIDIVATMLDLAGSDNLKKLRGSSLLPLILGKQSHPGFAYCESNSEGNCTGSYMIRKGNWKYIHFSFYDHLLFNLEKDPGEFNNLINKPETAEIQKELRDILYSIVDPEEITVRSFRLHERILADFARNMTEDQLFDMLISRLGPGQARILAKKCKGF